MKFCMFTLRLNFFLGSTVSHTGECVDNSCYAGSINGGTDGKVITVETESLVSQETTM